MWWRTRWQRRIHHPSRSWKLPSWRCGLGTLPWLNIYIYIWKIVKILWINREIWSKTSVCRTLQITYGLLFVMLCLPKWRRSDGSINIPPICHVIPTEVMDRSIDRLFDMLFLPKWWRSVRVTILLHRTPPRDHRGDRSPSRLGKVIAWKSSKMKWENLY